MTRLVLVAAISGLLLARGEQAPADIITFDDQGLTGPSWFWPPPPYLPPQNVSVTAPGGVGVSFSGGIISTNETYNWVDRTSLYATAGAAGAGYSRTLTIQFDQPITNFICDVMNGCGITTTFQVADNQGHSSVISLAPDLGGGMAQVSIPAVGQQVTVTQITNVPAVGGWDFSIDNIQFNIARLTWTGAAGSQWDTQTENWATMAGTTAKYADGAPVAFNDTNPLTGANVSNTTVTIPSPVSPGSVTFNNSGAANGGVDYTIAGAAIAGTGALIKNGAGTVTLRGANTYSGVTQINAGTLCAGVAENPGVSGPFGAQPASAAGTILFGVGTLQYSTANQFDYSGRFSTAGNQCISIDTNGQTVTFATPIQGAGTSLTLSDSLGTGRLVLAAANTYTEGTTINGGTLCAGAAENPGVSGPFGAQPAAAAGTILFGGGTLQYSPANQFDYSGRFSTDGNQPISIDTNGQTVTFATAIQSGGTSLTLTDSLGTGVLILTAPSTYAGRTTINSGTLQLGDGVANDGSIRGDMLNNGAVVFANLESQTYSGNISGGGSLTKVGGGTLVLSGNSTYTGLTRINAGTLGAGAAENPGVSGPFGAQPAAAAGTILFGGGTLQYSPANQFDYSGRFSNAGSQSINIDTNGQTVTFATAIQGAGTSLTLNDPSGDGTLILAGANTYTGPTTIIGGTLNVQGSIASAGPITVNNGAALSLTGGGAISTGTDLTLYKASLSITYGGSLSITGGGIVSNSGYGNLSGGVVTVDGAGSAWINDGELFVLGGTLSLTNGGAASSSNSYVGCCSNGANSGSTGVVTVDGAGSTWSNNGDLYVGYCKPWAGYYAPGSGTLSITNGGAVLGNNGYIGCSANGSYSGATGVVTVDGAGSSWTNDGDLYVGYSSGGTLNVTSGGGVANSNNGYVGYASGSAGRVTVDGADSAWANIGDLYVGYSASGTLSISNSGSVGNNNGWIGYASGATGTVSVDGIESEWNNTGDLRIGCSGSGVLNITNGGFVSNENGWVGYALGSTGSVTVDGAESTWFNERTLCLGYSGSGTLSVTNGGSAWSNGTCWVGYAPGGVGAATVDGAGSSWTVFGDLYLGYSGNGTLGITNGGAVANNNGWIGYAAGSTGTVTVSGSNSTWDSQGSLCVGCSGTGVLNIANGGTVGSSCAYIGYANGSTGSATIDGSGSTWTNDADLCIGCSGTGALNITNGGAANSNNGYVGYAAGSLGAVTVAGAGSSWSNNGDLYVGCSGTGGLSITNGGAANSNNGYVGYAVGSLGAVTVAGAGSSWSNNGDLYLGYYGAGALSITNGGAVDNMNGWIGYASGSLGAVTVSGTGSTWTNNGDLYVGNSGSGTLSITRSGAVSNNNGWIGCAGGSTGQVAVDGTGSTWTNNGDLYVGNSGSGTLSITRSGAVNNNNGWLGYAGGSTGKVTVDGTGSTWTNSGDLYVGNSGSGTLSITRGGAVNNNNGWIGYAGGSTGQVAVDGTGSTWTNNGDLHVGNSGSGTLTITNGGSVTAANVYVGSGAGTSLLAIDVGCGSSLVVGGGTGTITNNDTIRIAAAAGAAAGAPTSCTPISAGTWGGTGTYQVLGGTWNPTTHVFTTSNTLSAAAGSPITFDQASVQRLLFTDSATKASAGASFTPATTPSTMTFTASTMGRDAVATLQNELGPNEPILSGWSFAADGYTPGTPVYLSIDVGPGQSPGNLEIWHYNGSAWSPYPATALTYDGTDANFIVTGFSGYAIAAPATFAWAGAVSGNWNTADTSWTAFGGPAVYADGCHVRFDDTGANTNITVQSAGVYPASVTFTNTAVAYTVGGGPIAGTCGLTVSGSGQVILTGSNSYTGGTSVVNGMLAVENVSAIPSGSLLAIGADGSVVLGTPGYTEIGMNPGGGPAGPLGSQPSGGGGHPAPEPTTLLLLAAAAACGLAAATRRRKDRNV